MEKQEGDVTPKLRKMRPIRFGIEVPDYVVDNVTIEFSTEQITGNIVIQMSSKRVITMTEREIRFLGDSIDENERKQDHLVKGKNENDRPYSRVKYWLGENRFRHFKNLSIPLFPILFLFYFCHRKQVDIIENADLITAIIILYSQLISVYNNSNIRSRESDLHDQCL